MTHTSSATESPAVEPVWRAGFLEKLAQAPGSAPYERATSSPFPTSSETPVRWREDPNTWRQLPWPSPAGEGTRAHHDDDSIADARVLAAAQPDDILAALDLGGCRTAATRIRYLYEVTEEDPDESDIVMASLRELALFLLSLGRLVHPEIAVSPDGLLMVEWDSAERGILAMKFRPDGMIQCAGVSTAGGSGPRLRVNDTLPKDRATGVARAFLLSPDGLDARRPAT